MLQLAFPPQEEKEVNKMEDKKESNVSIWVWVIIVVVAVLLIVGFITFLKP
jgi:flagellar basal body-associated protein FliL